MTEIKTNAIPHRLKNVNKEHPYVSGAKDIYDDVKGKSQEQVNKDVDDALENHQQQINNEKQRAEGVEGGLNTRLETVEQLAEISIGGGDAQIATGADFTNPDATKRAKVPTVGAIVDGLNDGVYDVSKRNPTAGPNSDGKFTLDYILSNADTLIPTSWQHGGMTISFVDSSDNKYIQYRLKPTSFSLDPNDWTVDVDNVYTENDDIWAILDKKKRIIALVEPDGNVKFGKIPSQVTELLNALSNEIDGELYTKVDKEEGKTLIPAQYITEADDDCIVLRLDSKSRILSMIKEDGTNLFPKLDALNIGENLANQIRNAQTHDHIATVTLNGLLNIQSKRVGVDALVIDGTTLYFGGTGRPRLFVADFSSEINPSLIMESSEALPSGHIKEIVDNGDYLYVCGRDNGTGLNNDLVTPMYYFPFEGNSKDNNTNVLGFDSYTHSGSAMIDNTGAPAPCRFQHSAKLYKGNGTGSAILKKAVSITNDGQFSLWINNTDSVITDTVYIPLLMNNGSAVLSIAIDSNNKIGLRIGEQDYFGTHVLSGAWRNVKIVMSSSNISMYVRYKECDSDWGEAVVSQSISGITADNICVGIETQSEGITILIDDLAFDTADIDTKVAIDGFLSVVRKSDLHIMKTYKSNLRCLSMLKDGNTLYLGMIGGVNSYDVSDPTTPILIGYNRESNRTWLYPKNVESNYHYDVNGDETQRLCFMNNGATKYLVGGSDSVGIVIYNITNPANITLYKAVRDVPQVQARVIATGTIYNSAQYIEWGVYADYPYIYSTVASPHSLHNGVNELVHPERDTVYGMKVRDISDINNIKSKIVPIPEEWYNTFDVNDGDSRPTSLAKFGGQIVMGNADKGILVFSVDGMKSEWLYGKKMPNNGRTNRMFISNDGRVFATDYTATVDNPDCYIYLLRGIF